ncbi:hypothetical protein PFISCL1PPCAC_1172 [Pristionchus fissidentatus]|uniref:Uncharacterized protein n=1 Tax=Pristionchus fissidentatus TaxID=1538716 RepID=A0AAV5URS4_9BILA|nr:hypothetical protein PFISCL1PPCAC_1172 [Pristionchus fissidentatus]
MVVVFRRIPIHARIKPSQFRCVFRLEGSLSPIHGNHVNVGEGKCDIAKQVWLNTHLKVRLSDCLFDP